MNLLYLWLNIGSFVVPFLFSFHPKLKFYKKWKFLFPAIAIMMAFFIPWDILFTRHGIWGFNETYISGYKIFNLPIEEWLFFICIPYACIFSYYAVLVLFPNFGFKTKTTSVLYIILQTILVVTLLIYYDRLYTAINFGYAIVLLAVVYNCRKHLLRTFFPIFAFILIPFFIVNGVLTGTGLEDPVVWYNNYETLGIRLVTIPIEDSIYALTMLLTVLVLTEEFAAKKDSSNV